MKKFLMLMLLLAVLYLPSCKEKTPYDDKTISKIEVEHQTSFIFTQQIRTFDFSTLEVTDTEYVDENFIESKKKAYLSHPEYYKEYENLETFEAYLSSIYNTPILVSTFTQESGDAFIEKVVSLGIYTWKDSYDTKDTIFDASGFSIKIYFTDDTIKSTHFFFKYPSNFEAIKKAFIQYFNLNYWWHG